MACFLATASGVKNNFLNCLAVFVSSLIWTGSLAKIVSLESFEELLLLLLVGEFILSLSFMIRGLLLFELLLEEWGNELVLLTGVASGEKGVLPLLGKWSNPSGPSGPRFTILEKNIEISSKYV